MDLMKKAKLLGMIVCAALLTGCGGEYAGVSEGDIVSGSAVSGDAVSGDAIREKAVSGPAVEDGKEKSQNGEKQDMSSHRFCTDTNLYYVTDGNKIMQARVDGTHRKCIREWSDEGEEENYVYVTYVDENWLYYEVSTRNSEDKGAFIYRAPITTDEAGQDVVWFQKEEELVKAEFLGSWYVDSDYYFYADLATGGITKYDLKRKKKVSECKDVLGGDIFRINDHYLCVCGGGIYTQKTDQAQWEKLSFSASQWEGEEYIAVQNDHAMFIAAYISDKARDWGVNIKRCDEKAETDFATWEDMVRTVTEAAGVKELDICGVEDYFWQGDRLYIQMQAGWIKEGHYHMEYMMISKGENERGSDSRLRYEKELTECMKSHVKERKGKWIVGENYDEGIHITANDARCIGMFDGKAYLSLYDYVKDQGRLGCYDLETGKFEWIAKNSAAFYKYKSASGEESDEIADAFDDGEENAYTDIWSFPPSKIKEGVGVFMEDE